MAGNTFGNTFKLTTFGESHGAAIGGIIDGCPSGICLDIDFVQLELNKRKPGQSKITTQRKEADKVEFLSGLFEGTTTGTPIGFIIRNENQKSKDYSHLKENYRPSHADYTYQEKYGVRDYRGGGRSSARETACRVVAGAIAKQILKSIGVTINAFVRSVGEIELKTPIQDVDFSNVEETIVRCPDLNVANEMIAYIESIRKEGDTVGGVISCVINNTPIGLGEPVFDKLNADLGKAILSINAVKGFELGSGFAGSKLKGSKHNDLFTSEDGDIKTLQNNSGGIQGGISNGESIYFNVAFKPVATIMQKQNSVNQKGEKIELAGKGRHDPCVVPRAVVIVEAMSALTILDFYLRNKAVTI
jgi:chorismate synthase